MARARSQRTSIERIVASEARVRAVGKLSGVAARARQLKPPADYFGGIDWTRLGLPRNVLCFQRDRENHDLRGWSGISASSGKFDLHGRFVLLSVLEGRGTVGVDAEVFPLQEGESLLIFPYQRHYYLDFSKEFSWLFTTFELEASHWSQLRPLYGGPRCISRKGRRLLNQLLEVYLTTASPKEALNVSLVLHELLVELAGAEAAGGGEAGLGFAGRVRKYVFQHLEDELSLELLARELSCSPVELREEFRRETGISLAGFVKSVRLVQAAYLLLEKDESPAQLAQRCGFRSYDTFATSFEDLFRVSPEEFRERGGE